MLKLNKSKEVCWGALTRMVSGYYKERMNFERDFIHIPNTILYSKVILENKLGWLKGG